MKCLQQNTKKQIRRIIPRLVLSLKMTSQKPTNPKKIMQTKTALQRLCRTSLNPKKESVPPAPPKIEDEKTLTNPDKKPAYEPEQTNPQQTTSVTNTDTPKHGDTKDGMIYIEGFGWVKDEGGGGVGYTDSEMYENGNKIGYFG